MTKCLGCGIELQNENPNGLGYTKEKEYFFCERCFQLKNYGKYQGVPFSNEDYQKIQQKIPRNCCVLYISDVLSLDFLEMEQFSKVILVITKKDILPKSVKIEKIIAKLKKQYPNLLEVIMVSSKNNDGLDELYQLILRYSRDKEVYLVGTTNSGKSTLLNKLIHNYGTLDTKGDITVSMYPSTTLDMVRIKLNGLQLVDTPGLINEGSIVNYVDSSDLKQITPKKEIKPKSCQIKGHGSIMIGTFARIDYQCEEDNSIVIYVAAGVMVRFASLKSDYGHDYSKYSFSLSEHRDVVIPGLGFIKCVKPIWLEVYVLDGVVPYDRDSLI